MICVIGVGGRAESHPITVHSKTLKILSTPLFPLFALSSFWHSEDYCSLRSIRISKFLGLHKQSASRKPTFARRLFRDICYQSIPHSGGSLRYLYRAKLQGAALTVY